MNAPLLLADRPATKAAPRRPAPHPLRAELLRGLAPWAGLALAVALGAYLYNTSETWQGSWTDTLSVLRAGGVILGGPLALAAGCWQGGRERRRGTDVLRATAVRGPLAQLLMAALPLACWLVAAYVLTFVGGVLASRPYATPGGFTPTAFAGSAAVLVACALTGHVVGALVPWRLAAPLLGVVGYGLFGAAGTTESVLRFLGPAPEGFRRSVVLEWWHPFLTAGWFLALAAAAVLACAARRRTALVPLVAAAVAGTLLVQVGDGLSRPDPRAHRQVCTTDTAPQICVNGTRARQLPEVTEALRPLIDRLKGVENLPVRFEDLPGRPDADEASLPMLSPLGWYLVRGRIVEAEQFRWEAATILIGGSDCPFVRREPAKVALVDDAVTRWLAPSHISDEIRRQRLKIARANGDKADLRRLKTEQRAYDHLRTMSPAERRAWLSRYFAQDRCGRTDSEVPSL
ncbi:hypothetical protein [Streptomyces sp. NPDC057694]|uniref:hypothetical protein n=1 Tax=Streptomyces sp. NPDC057694 TaxID=3346216 RepID=UPI0036A34659